MRISHAIEVVLREQSEFDHVNTADEAVDHVLSTLMTQAEFKAAGRVHTQGVWVLDGPDPEHPQFDEGYFAHETVIDWYRRPIKLATYLNLRIMDELGEDDWDAPFDGWEHALDSGLDAGVRAAERLLKHVLGPLGRADGFSRDLGRDVWITDLSVEIPADVWSNALGDADPAKAFDADKEGREGE